MEENVVAPHTPRNAYPRTLASPNDAMIPPSRRRYSKSYGTKFVPARSSYDLYGEHEEDSPVKHRSALRQLAKQRGLSRSEDSSSLQANPSLAKTSQEPEDSFYTLSNSPSFAFSHFSNVTSSPDSSFDLSRNLRPCPETILGSPLARLLVRPPRLDTSASHSPQPIIEGKEDIHRPELGFERDEHDVFDRGQEPLGPVLPLGDIALEASKIDPSQLDLASEDRPVEECVGCGLKPDRSFVILIPCLHSCCPDCLNSIINGAAHKPPRPADCFACSHAVDSFEPSHSRYFTSRGGPGLAQVLAYTLQHSARRRRTASHSPVVKVPATRPFVKHEDLEFDRQRRLSRNSRRRSSVVAAAIATTLSSRKRRTASPAAGPSSPVSPLSSLASRPLPVRHEGVDGARADRLPPPPISLSNLRSISSEAVSGSPDRNSPGRDASKPLIDWSEEYLPGFDDLCLESSDESHPSGQNSELDSDDDYFPQSLPPRPIEWPVVRLDNVPWDITADDIEHWLPDGTLASDTAEGPELIEVGLNERVALAVHILCNRLDGRTLNQAFVECSSPQAAKAVVRTRDGARLKGRPLHLSISSQSELLSTIFPTHARGFDGLDAIYGSTEILTSPLLLASELSGLLNLCRLDTHHASKAPDRPYFNLVSIIEKYPFHQREACDPNLVSSLFETCLVAVETLKTVHPRVPEWRAILTIFVDSILRCPAFGARQKMAIVKLSGGIKFAQPVPSTTDEDVFQSKPAVPALRPLVSAPFQAVLNSTTLNSEQRHDGLVSEPRSPDLSSHPEQLNPKVSASLLRLLTATSTASAPILGSSAIPSPTYSFPPAPSSIRNLSPVPENESSSPAELTYTRRRSSIARLLDVDSSVVAAVAKELGIVLV
ncbi:RNA-binding protein [Sporobolomyces koalae]|uniref:RNA-binding protein n=1 Tax=Sporobolomyces koalae TaxID=500713 RepID=UPI00317B87AC